MVSTCRLISESSSLFGDCWKTTIYNWYNCHFHVLQVFRFSSPGTYTIFRFLSILLSGKPGQQTLYFGKFSFFWLS